MNINKIYSDTFQDEIEKIAKDCDGKGNCSTGVVKSAAAKFPFANPDKRLKEIVSMIKTPKDLKASVSLLKKMKVNPTIKSLS